MTSSLSTRFRSVLAALSAVLLAFAFAPASTQAQQASPAAQGDMQELRAGLIAAQLDLTDAQRTELESILADEAERQRALSQKYRQRAQNADSAAIQGMRQEMQREAETMQEQTQTQLAEVLDEDQMESYRLLYVQEQDAQAAGPDSQESPVARILDQRTAELDLTDEQREQLRPIYEQQMQQAQQLREEAQQARGDQQAMEELRQRAQQMQQEMENQVSSVLTEEQMQQRDEIQAQQQKIQQARQRQMQQMRQQMQQRQQGGAPTGGGQ